MLVYDLSALRVTNKDGIAGICAWEEKVQVLLFPFKSSNYSQR